MRAPRFRGGRFGAWGARRAAVAMTIVAAIPLSVAAQTAGSRPLAVPVAPLALAERGEMNRVPVRLTVTGTTVGPLTVGQPDNGLGQPVREVASFFEDLLGPPTNVSTFRDRVLIGCFGGEVFVQYTWPGVLLGFSGAEGSDRSADRWVNFRFDDRVGSELLLGVQSTRGARIGDSLDIWLNKHPDARLFEGDELDGISTTLELPDGLIAEIGRDDDGTAVVQTLSALPPLYCE